MKGQKKTAPKNRDDLKTVVRMLSPHRGSVLLSLLFGAVYAGLAILIPLLFGQAVDALVGEGLVNFTVLNKKLLTAGALTLLAAAGSYCAGRANNRIVCRLTRDLRRDLFRKIQALPLSYLDAHPHGETLSKVIADVDQFADGLMLFLTQFFSGILTILGTLAVLVVLDPLVALAVFFLTPLSLFVSRFITNRTKKYFRLRAEKRGELVGFTEETVSAIRTVKAFGQEKKRLSAFDALGEDLGKATLKAVFYSSITNPATRFVNALVYAAVALTGSVGVLGGRLTVGLLVTVLGYANQYTKPFNEISAVLAELQNALTNAGRIRALLDEAPEAPDPESPVELGRADGDVRFEQVDFSYDKTRPFIEDLSLSAKKGQTVALVGPTGCGKTTLMNLLMRFYDPDAGVITLDGRDVAAVTRKALRSNVGMVLQDTWLQAATVRENLKAGRPDADDEKMIAAAKKTRAHDFIKRLPDGYDTVLSEDGGALSEGQKQLLSITRVLLADPNILILDEATSSIDLATEIEVQAALRELTKGRTCLVVAHRLSTVMNADAIAVMRDGKIVEWGDHDTLLRQNGLYRQMWDAMRV